jgi:hypothetical protein
MKKHIISNSPDLEKYEWSIEKDSDGDPVVKINGRIVFYVNITGEKLLLDTETIEKMGLSWAPSMKKWIATTAGGVHSDNES